MRSQALIWLFGSLMLMSPLAHSQSCTATMADIAFGNVSTIQPTAAITNGNINIRCSGYATPYARVCISIGSPNTFDPRSMNGPTSTKLTFDIYKDSSFTNVLGSVYQSSTAPLAVSVPLSGGTGTLTAVYYAKLSSNQITVPSGSYSVAYTAGDTRVQSSGYSGSPPSCGTSMSGSANFTFNVSATVAADCNVTASNIDFGQRGLANTTADASGTVSSTCTFNAPYKLTIDAGQGAGSSMTARKLTRSGGSETMAYALYTDAARTQIWGDGSGGTSMVSGTGNGALQTSTVYARLPPGAAVRPGAYVDSLVLTITY